MERLRAAEDRGHGLDGGTGDVDFGLLRGEGGAGGLGVEAKHPGARILRAEALAHDAGPEAAGGAEFGDLFDEVVVRVEEEREARGEAVDVETGVDGSLDVGHAVGQGEGDLLRGGGAGLAHVVAGDGDGVPIGDFGGSPGEHVGDDAHGVGDGIDIRAARDVLLQDVVLHGAGELLDVGSASPGRGDIEGEQNAGGGVDGHRGGDGVELYAVEEALHIFDGVDGDADLADFTEGHGVVGVVADLGGEIEGYGETRGAVGEEEFVTAIGLFCIAHAGVLTHGPETAAVHGGLDAAGEGVLAGEAEVAVRIEAGGGEVVFRPECALACARHRFFVAAHRAILLPRREALTKELTQK